MSFITGRALTRREALLAVPGLAVAGRLLAQQAGPAAIGVRGISSVTLAVSDVARSVAFYQELFGLPVQARQGSKVLLRLGNGPYFLGLTPADAAGPRIDHWGLAVESFDPNRVVDMLAAHGVTRADSGPGLAGGPMHVKVSTRGDTREVYMADGNGLVMQLQDPSYCGGSGPRGDGCEAAEPAPRGAPLSLSALSHLTINVPDPDATNAFYRRVFGLDIQEYQAASPLLGVGPGPDFLMFIAAGGGRGAAPTPARVNHVSLALPGFSVAGVQAALEAHGIRPRPDAGGTGPLLHWVSMRMPNRGGAEGGTPELYFSDPDGLSIQVQDPSYCGGGGYLGEICNG